MKKNKMIATLLIAMLCVSMWVTGVSASNLGGSASITFYGNSKTDSRSGSGSGGSGKGTQTIHKKDADDGSSTFLPNRGGGNSNQAIFDLEADTIMILDEGVPLAQLGTLPKTGGTNTAGVNPFTGSNGLVPALLCLAGAICLAAAVDQKPVRLGL